MSPTDTQPSVRLIRAALAEREGLERQRVRLQAVRSKVLAELRRIDDAMSTLAEREMLLERLAPPAGDSCAPAKPPTSVASVPRTLASAAVDEQRSISSPGRPDVPPIEVLRGPSIRRVAVAILLDRGLGALHYREWFQMLGEEGYAVEGKDPLAVFLTQISRSPVVQKSTQSGVYELDLEAPQRLRRRIAQLHSELRELTTPSADGADLGQMRGRRTEITAAIGHAERALEEAESLIAGGRSSSAETDQLPRAS
jgi:hypothetical protein